MAKTKHKENLENVNPLSTNHISNHVAASPKHYSTMSSSNTPTCSPNQKDYPAAALIHSIASSASTRVANASRFSPCLQPLSESNTNEQTPRKLFIDQPTTPTCYLKILCDAAAIPKDDSSSSCEAPVIREEPVTPTANLKMLISAASPEIRSLEKSKKELFQDVDEESSSKGPSVSRKEKSLGLLCQRFMAEFEPFPSSTERIEVCLDELAGHLGVERRRIYDIVNVLESVEIMSRRAKNRYLWHGKTQLRATLVKLKYFAETEQIDKQLELMRELEVVRTFGRKMDAHGNLEPEDTVLSNHPKLAEYMEAFGNALRKEKSLGIMSQKFLMLFLSGKTKTINLDLAAKVLLGDPTVDTKNNNSKFKTKIRRLYDIANILTSLQLISKVHVTEVRGRKPAFTYIGPDVEPVVDEYRVLKDIQVQRPGRVTLDMKMDELKNKMEQSLQPSKTPVKQVPPVTVPAPERERLRVLNTLLDNSISLSQLAGEQAERSRQMKELQTTKGPPSPDPASPEQPCSVLSADSSPVKKQFVLIQHGTGDIVVTDQPPMFMENEGGDPCQGAVPLGNNISGGQGVVLPTLVPPTNVTLMPLGNNISGTPVIIQAQLAQQLSPHAIHSPRQTHALQKILPHITTASQKRAAQSDSDDLRIINDWTITKSDKEYIIARKRPAVEGSRSFIRHESFGSTASSDRSSSSPSTAGDITPSNSLTPTKSRPAVSLLTPQFNHLGQSLLCQMSTATSCETHVECSSKTLTTPVNDQRMSARPLLYNTPALVPIAAKGSHSVTSITFLASPQGTPVNSRAGQNPSDTPQQAIRKLTLK